MNRKLKTQLAENPSIMRSELLCNTLGNMPVPLLTLTENVESYLRYEEQLALQSGL
jgi:hypothetical protein